MPKLEIDLTDDQLERLEAAAKPFETQPAELVSAMVTHLIAPQDEKPSLEITDLAIRGDSLRVEIRHDRAILLADLLRQLELPMIDQETDLSARLDRHQAYLLREWQDAIEAELPADFEAYLESARRTAEKSQNWLDVKDLPCDHCQRTFGWQLYSPFNAARLLHCDNCPRRLEISVYDPKLDELEDLHLEIEQENLEIEKHLAPCPCGGSFRFEARRRCPYCSEPVEPRLGDVGNYNLRCAYPLAAEQPLEDSLIEDLVITEASWRD